MLAFAGLAVDTGFYVVATMKLQDGADAAALAGATQVLFNDPNAIATARTLAVNTAGLNLVTGQPLVLNRNDNNVMGKDLVIGHYERATGQFTIAPQDLLYGRRNAVMVNATRAAGSSNPNIIAFFGPIFRVPGYQATRTAIAMTGDLIDAAVIVLNYTQPAAYSMNGNASLIIQGGTLQVNSIAGNAVNTKGGATIDVDLANITGGTSSSGHWPFQGEALTGQPRVEDPFALLPAPEYNTHNDLGKVKITGNATVHLTPGYYSGGITMTNGTAILAPGVYVLDGAGLDVNGGNLLVRQPGLNNPNPGGVLFYIVGKGSMNLGGNGTIDIRPLDPTRDTTVPADIAETYQKVSIFQARDNNNPAIIRGTSQISLSGALYLPDALLDIGGTGDWSNIQLISDTLSVQGNSSITINYPGGNPAMSHAIFLVQ
jgi:hypothetical protein